MNEAEWQTRKQRIDTRLRAIQPPWKIIRYREGLDVDASRINEKTGPKIEPD